VGAPSPEAWTDPQTFTASSGNTVSVVIGAAAFGNVDPLPGVYKTVQVQQLSTPQNITVNGQPVTVPALSSSSTCQLLGTPSSIAFQNTTVGYSISYPASITSNCSTTVTVNSVQSSAPFGTSGVQTPFSLTPGQTQSYTAVFSPTATGTTTGNLLFASNSSSVQSLSVALIGTGVASPQGVLSSSPNTLSFGSVVINTTQTLVATITNTGAASVSVSAVNVAGTGFALVSLSTPLTLAVNQSVQVTIRFTPQTISSASGTLTIQSTAQNSTLTVPLAGTGVSHSVSLSWSSSGSQIAGYNVYRSSVSNGPYTRINSALVVPMNYSDQTVSSGATYYYTVTAVGTNGVESAYSSQVSATIP
jgi:hypothetical protein